MPELSSNFRKKETCPWMSFFYRSTIYRLISEGVSDLHCMSDEYLTEELISEYKEKNQDSF